MKVLYGNNINMFVVFIYFFLKNNIGFEEDIFFRILIDICVFFREGFIWEFWLFG